MKKRILSILLTLCMVLMLMPQMVFADEGGVKYLNWDSADKKLVETQYTDTFSLVNNSNTTWGIAGDTTWYVAQGNVIIDSRVTVTGDVHLILMDDCNLTVNGGIEVISSNSLTIYAQSTDENSMGMLNARAIDQSAAGIGGYVGKVGQNITINGGKVEATGFLSGAGIGGGTSVAGRNITINGGVVEASSTNGAGIGGGAGGGKGEKITINGGVVEASSTRGAGIGCGSGADGPSKNIIINGGTVIANGGTGIGGGTGNDFSTGDNGNAVIFASSISDQSGKAEDAENPWSGVIFEGTNDGVVYGTSVTPSEDFTIPADKTLTIESGKTLIIPDGVILTNNGTINDTEDNGKICVEGEGTLKNNGKCTCLIFYHLTLTNCEVLFNNYQMVKHDEKIYVEPEGEVGLKPNTPPEGYVFDSWEVSPAGVTIEDNGFTMPAAALTVTARYKDIEKPVISGVEDGKTYCDEVQFEVSDNDGVASVTANDVTLTPDANNKYTLEKGIGTVKVVATDKSGNTADVTVTVNNGHTWSNGVCSVCGYVCNHTGGTEIRGATAPSCTAAGYTGDTYCLVCGVKILAGTIINKSSHIDKDKDHLCDVCGATVSEHSLENIPAKEATVTETGNREYWQCQDCKKYFSDADGVNEITDLESWKTGEGLIDKLPPEIIKGKEQSITAGEKKALSFASNAAYSDFIRVELDGKTLDEKNYTVKEGSTVVTLNADYVATLPAGEHTIGIVSESGTAATTFTVNVKVNAWAKTVLRLQSTASKTSIKLKWNEVPEADGYVIYWNKCGAKNGFKQVKVIESGKTLTWTHKNRKADTWNKYYVKAYKVIDGKRSFIKTSNKIHLVTKGGKYTNVKKLKSKVSDVTLNQGKTKALKITQTYAEKNKKPTLHMRTLTYTTSDKTVATVTSKGVIKAKGAGSCDIYITAHNGVYMRVKVTVK